jgi:hypothetical protein
MTLLDDLKHAAAVVEGCPLCVRIAAEEDEETKDWLISASAGTIGTETLAGIFKKNGVSDPRTAFPIGRRTIVRHREEKHTP